jgi:maltose O-acetyltransferase
MTERQKMLAGEPYKSWDPELIELRRRARRMTREFNGTNEDDGVRRTYLLKALFGGYDLLRLLFFWY